MAQQRQATQDEGKRQARAERILDAAAGLILRWGYNKTTIDDIARQAGVAKGTIYLHWKTREALFTALLQRERIALLVDLKQRIAADPAGATLRGIFKHSALALIQRPLLKAVLLRDMEITGKLAHGAHHTRAYAERVNSFMIYLDVLREQGLVRTDLNQQAQVYIMTAIFMGFFLIAPFTPDEWTPSDDELAELLAETMHRALEPVDTTNAAALQSAAQAAQQYLDQDMAIGQMELQQGLDA